MATETPKTNPLDDALIEVIKKTTNAVEAGADFLAAQLPEVIQQLLMWHAVKSGVLCVAFIVASIAFVVVAKRCRAAYTKSCEGGRYSGEDAYMFMCIIACAISSTAVFLALSQALKCLQILIAPKVYLIEYAAALIK